MKDTYVWLGVKKFLFTTRIIICGLWKEPERDRHKACQLASKRSAFMSEQQSCIGTSGNTACKGDFPFLYEYKTNVDFV